jgi:RNA polymerase sigma-70 factor (ECF subfamily)
MAAASSATSPQTGSPRLPAVAEGHREDVELTSRMRAGDERALDVFAERYVPALYRFAAARLRGDRELTRDLVQSTLAKALSRLGTYRGEASLLTWLCACCRNEVLMHLRRGRAAPQLVDLDAAELTQGEPPGGDAEGALLRRERATLVHVTLDALPERYARVLEWKYLERLPVETIAARLGLGLKAAESLLGRAREAFRTTYEDLGREDAASGRGEDRRR